MRLLKMRHEITESVPLGRVFQLSLDIVKIISKLFERLRSYSSNSVIVSNDGITFNSNAVSNWFTCCPRCSFRIVVYILHILLYFKLIGVSLTLTAKI